jgi:phosphoglycerol transferase MdoB-like AlkP superfamily enzyme
MERSKAIKVYSFLSSRAFSVLIFAALWCNLSAKFYRSIALHTFSDYFGWILSDVAVLLAIEAAFSFIYFKWSKRWVFRALTIFSAIICTWSVINAAWLIRTGTQILPSVLLPLFRDPLNSLGIVIVNLARMPVFALLLLVPSGIALTFLFVSLAWPKIAVTQKKQFFNKTLFVLLIIFVSVLTKSAIAYKDQDIVTKGLYYNCHLKAVTSLVSFKSNGFEEKDFADFKRRIPFYDEVQLEKSGSDKPNIVIIILEGIQHNYTSLAKNNDLTPYLTKLAAEGVEFSNTRANVTHTTKALFSLHTGLYPGVYQDTAETVIAQKPYISLASILRNELGYRTAFFQSAKGNFECRPGLVHNLGFEKFWSRENLDDPNHFVGYLGSDEFAMLEPMTKWIKSKKEPFLMTVMCSVTHDPYELPKSFDDQSKRHVERYKQTIAYTDGFIKALDTELAELGIKDDTIFCVIGDHGEAFGEHGFWGHERIAFEEALRIPWVLRPPVGVKIEKKKITENASSIDLTPTILSLLDFNLKFCDFDGINMLAQNHENRKVYFSGWVNQCPAGFVEEQKKYIYDPTVDEVFCYDLGRDPNEISPVELKEQEAQQVSVQIDKWRLSTIFQVNQIVVEKVIFDSWLCESEDRVGLARFLLVE